MPPLSTDYVFMSYSRRDDTVMRRIVAFLRGQGIKVWVDNEKLIPGTPVWEKEIEKAVQGASAVVVVLSPDSKDSEWVRREISLADQYEKRVFPLLVRGDEKTSISIRLIGRQYVDIRSNEDAGLNYVSATLLRYLEELNKREQNAKKEADRLAAQKIKTEKRLAARKAEEERIALEKVEAERKAKEDADRLIAQKTEEERIALEKVEADRKAKEDVDHLIAQKAEEERIALEKIATERKAKEEADRLAEQKAELDSKEKLARENTEREAREKLACEKSERDAREKEKRETKVESTVEKPVVTKSETKKQFGMKLPLWGIGLIAFAVLALIVWGLSSFPASPKATPAPDATETPVPTPALGIGSTEISPKDGMTLLYVPAGEFTMGSDVNSDERPIHNVALGAYWIDQTEVTNAQYAKCVADNAACKEPTDKSSSTHSSYYGNSEFDHYPVLYVDWNMANAYCSWAGRKLPTEAEWEKAARGTDVRIYPWGNDAPNKDLLNYNSSDTTVVKNYLNTASFYGTYDMAGNVWEWVNDYYGETYYQSSNSTNNPLGPESGQDRVMRGGSWYGSDYFVRSAFRLRNAPSINDSSLGFRCSHSLADTANQSPTVTVAPIATQAPALGIGSTMIGNDGMTLLYVPAGEFLMGSTDADTLAYNNEKPQHLVTLDAYWIDQTEVTNAMYANCLNAGNCDSTTMNVGTAEYPVVWLDWNQANVYCAWAGRRLPTEAEWEKAARGTDGRTYPWGNKAPNSNLLNYNNEIDKTTPVFNYPNGFSPYGAYDMAGNVWEWVNDWYDVYPNGNSSASSDFGQKYRVGRGGSWNSVDVAVRSANRRGFDPTSTYNVVGFRCARSLP